MIAHVVLPERVDEVPPVQGHLQYQDPHGVSPTALLTWQVLPLPREGVSNYLQLHRTTRREAEERRRAQQINAILPQATAARVSAVDSCYGERLYDMNEMPRSVGDLRQHVFEIWSNALGHAIRDPMVYGASVAPTSSNLSAYAVDHVLNSIQFDVIGTEDDAGPSGPDVFGYQQR